MGTAGIARGEVADGPVELSVVMPCLNEARTVGTCVEKARAAMAELGVAGEVVVADNGSTDGSPELARARGARVVRAERRGYGATLQVGIAAARGRFVIMGDSDDSYDFTLLGPFLDRLGAGDDLVMGNRFRGGIMPGAMPWHHRYIGNPVLTGILNLFFRSPIGDAHCGLRGFRKEAYQGLNLTSPGMEFASEMVVKACLQGLRVSEVPVVLHPDGRDRRPHLRSFHDGWRHLRLLLLLCPTWLYLIPAALMMALGLTLMVWLTPGGRWTGHVMLDVHTMTLGALCMLLSYQMVWMWAHAKVHGWVARILPLDSFIRAFSRHFTLERGVLAGSALLLAGLACDACVLGEWYARDLGSLEVRTTLRLALWGLTAMVLGAQTISGSFLLSMQCMESGPSAGDPAAFSWRNHP
jgi:hypothetical protein